MASRYPTLDVMAEPKPALSLPMRMIVVVVLLALGGVTFTLFGHMIDDLLHRQHPIPALVFGWVSVVALATIHGWAVWVMLTSRPVSRLLLAAVGVQSLLPFCLLVVLGPYWVGSPLFGFTNVMLLTRGRVRLAIAVAATTAYLVTTYYVLPYGWVENSIEWLVGNAVYFCLVALLRLAVELSDARAELTQLAVDQERMRMARDLHDSLGHLLSVVLLKLELAERLGARDSSRARTEVDEAREVLRSAAGEMDELVSGMRNPSLRLEIESAQSVLMAAGIETRIAGQDTTVDGPQAEALAWVVREGTTNVLRHSAAAGCEIVLSRDDAGVRLTMCNDGSRLYTARAPSGGNGLANLRERLAAVGGELSTSGQPGAGFALTARVP